MWGCLCVCGREIIYNSAFIMKCDFSFYIVINNFHLTLPLTVISNQLYSYVPIECVVNVISYLTAKTAIIKSHTLKAKSHTQPDRFWYNLGGWWIIFYLFCVILEYGEEKQHRLSKYTVTTKWKLTTVWGVFNKLLLIVWNISKKEHLYRGEIRQTNSILTVFLVSVKKCHILSFLRFSTEAF